VGGGGGWGVGGRGAAAGGAAYALTTIKSTGEPYGIGNK